MSKIIPDPPVQTPFDGPTGVAQSWVNWCQSVGRNLNRQGNRKPPYPQITGLTVGASPWTYQDTIAGDLRILVSGGTVSAITFSRDNITYYPTGQISGQITLSQGDYLRITYTVVPVVTAVPA